MAHFRKSKLTEQRLNWYKEYYVSNPWKMRGHWRELMPQAKRVHLDLGCGKGIWTTRVAKEFPNDLFIGIDYERMCVSFAVERAAKESLSNIFFMHDSAHGIESLFLPGEIDVVHINFPTPFPRKKEALNRITDSRRLMAYRTFLGESGTFHVKTDSQPFFDWTLEQLELAGYQLKWVTRDLQRNVRIANETHEINAPSKENTTVSPHAFLFEESSADFDNQSNSANHHEKPSDLSISPESSVEYELQIHGFAADTCDLTLSAYEEKFIPKGARIHALMALPGPIPENWNPSEKVSLVDYLPSDLDSIEYVPHGMQGTVENLRNRKRNEQQRNRN